MGDKSNSFSPLPKEEENVPLTILPLLHEHKWPQTLYGRRYGPNAHVL